MCFYCGCRELPLIRDLVTEHEAATDAAAKARLALLADDPATARELLAELLLMLQAHWRGEEEGLFKVMRAYAEYADYISTLEAEHRDLAELLRTADVTAAADRDRLLAAIDDLAEHIAKEEDGLFPASLTALSGDEWDAAIGAWVRVQAG